MTITLRDVMKENWQACVALRLAPEQEHFVASNAYSLAESKFMPTFVPQAIYASAVPDDAQIMVGFAMYGYYPDGTPPLGLRHWIFRLMIASTIRGAAMAPPPCARSSRAWTRTPPATMC